MGNFELPCPDWVLESRLHALGETIYVNPEILKELKCRPPVKSRQDTLYADLLPRR